MSRAFLYLAFIALFVTIGCGGGGGGGGSKDNDNVSADTVGGDAVGIDTVSADGVGLDVDIPGTPVTVTGNVLDLATSLPLAGVVVTAPGAQPTTTDGDGNFTLDAESHDGLAVRATLEGYTTAVVRVSADEASNDGFAPFVTITMKAVAATAQLDSAEGGTISDASGAQVTFPANAFITKEGQPVTGEVTVTITPINPYDPEDLLAFPGGFEALNADGEAGILYSYAVMDISATADGVPLTLAEGTTATVFFPLEDDVDAPETIALWSLDETSGLWKEEGTAIRRALDGKRYYEAEIPHLSSWNCDSFTGDMVEIKGTITSDDPDLQSAIANRISWFGVGRSQKFVANVGGYGDSVAFSAVMPANDFIALQINGYAGPGNTTFSSNAIFQFTPASGTVNIGNIVIVKDTCVFGTLGGRPVLTSKVNCNGHCMLMPHYCVPGLDPVHPCSTNNGGCLNGRSCVEIPAAAETSPSLWYCGTCPSGKTPKGLLDCQGVSCSISKGFCDDNATCKDGTGSVVCTCNSGYFGTGTSCKAWTACQPGQYLGTPGTTTKDRTCAACEAGTFSTTTNAASCTAWGTCAAGKYISAAGTASSDRVCTACPAGTFSTTSNVANCTPKTTCTPGQHIATAGTTTTDRTCTACEVGTFSATNNAESCATWTECPGDKYETNPGTASADRGCGDCDEGYMGNGTTCEPTCTHVMCGMNATCTAPDTCTCDEGYTGNGSQCTAVKNIDIDIAAGLTGNTTWNWASTDSVRAVEFYLGSMVTLTGVTVTGLPADKADTARIWIKTGAVNLQVTDTFPQGTPYAPTATTASSATFTLPTPKQIGMATYSIVVSVDDTDQGFQWEVLQFYNNAPSVTVDSITLESVWGWRGNVNVDTNTATDVSIYDAYMIQIPKVTLSFTN
jgi:hypothetical protein